MHRWKIRAIVYQQGLCCTFGWTRKIPMTAHWRRAQWTRWLLPYSPHLCLPDRRCYRCDKMSKLDQGPVPGVPLFTSSSASLWSSHPNQPLFPFHPPSFCFVFLPFNSVSPCLPQAKDQLATVTGQVRGSQPQSRRKLTYLLGWGEAVQVAAPVGNSQLLTGSVAQKGLMMWL